MWCDNIVLLFANPIQHALAKCIVLDLYHVQEKVLQGNLIVKHVPSSNQVADTLTKSISSSRFYKLRNKRRVQSLCTLNLRVDVSEDAHKVS